MPVAVICIVHPQDNRSDEVEDKLFKIGYVLYSRKQMSILSHL